jgi:hypothetical protein
MFNLFMGFAVKRSCFDGTLNFHIVGFNHGATDMDSLTFLETELSFGHLNGALIVLSDFAHTGGLVSFLTPSLHPESLKKDTLPTFLCWS